MNTEFVQVIQQRCTRDLLLYSRKGWLLYPLGLLLGYFSGLSVHSPRFFFAFAAAYTVMLVWRFIQFRTFPSEAFLPRWFGFRVCLVSAMWGAVAAYGVVYSSELAYAEALYFGSLALLGISGLVMYVPVFPVFMLHMLGYGVIFTVVVIASRTSDSLIAVFGSLLVQAGLIWVGRKQHLAHSRVLVSGLLLERRARELESAYARLKDVNNHRVEFMETLSSELHSSLDNINRLSEFLKQTPLENEQLRMVDSLRRTTRDLVQYLEGVAEISAVESGKAEFFQDQILLSRTLVGLFEEFFQQALLAGRSFVHRLQPGLPEVVQADRYRLLQLVRIMAENCLRMTDPGGVIRVHVEWLAEHDHSDQGRISMRFSDTGVGLDIHYIRNLIDDAYQATSDTDSPMRSVSMHFALLGRILFRMKGSFRVESLGDSGNAYEITIPLKIISWRSEGEQLEARFDSLGLDEDGLPRILLIDENHLNQRLLSKLCSVWGYSLEIASTSQQALQWIELRHFDLVLVDLLMPMFDSFGTILAIRQHAGAQQRHVPIVGLSNDLRGEGQRAAAAVGVSAFIGKPFLPDTLYQAISEQLNANNNLHV